MLITQIKLLANAKGKEKYKITVLSSLEDDIDLTKHP